MSGDSEPRARAARLAAVQILYEIDMVGADIDDVLTDFLERRAADAADGEARPRATLMTEIARGALADRATLDDVITGFVSSERGLARLDTVLRAVLRCGAFELKHRPAVPARVVVSTYSDIAAAFFDAPQDGVANAVLDRLARSLRAEEFAEDDPNAA